MKLIFMPASIEVPAGIQIGKLTELFLNITPLPRFEIEY
jgi:hypothetical protein